MCFSPDGRRLASISLDSGHMLTLWDWRSGTKLVEQRTQPGAPPAVYSVVWSAFEPSRLASFGQNHIRSAAGGRTCCVLSMLVRQGVAQAGCLR